MKIKIYKKIKSSGFTLIEALVAISLLMTAMASTMSVTQKALSSSLLSRDQMTASFLAQDGLEAIKNIRDHTAISTSDSWLSGLEICKCTDDNTCKFNSQNVTYCTIDTTEQTLQVTGPYILSSDSQNPLKIENTNDGTNFLKYDYKNTGASSKFSRMINIKVSGDNPNEAEVNVRVSWTSPLGPQNVDVNDFIYNYSPWTN